MSRYRLARFGLTVNAYSSGMTLKRNDAGVDFHLFARQLGTSIAMIEHHYRFDAAIRRRNFRVRSVNEPYERVVRESELSDVP